jgi:hypothetical protein
MSGFLGLDGMKSERLKTSPLKEIWLLKDSPRNYEKTIWLGKQIKKSHLVKAVYLYLSWVLWPKFIAVFLKNRNRSITIDLPPPEY